jgi:hypothetical protein
LLCHLAQALISSNGSEVSLSRNSEALKAVQDLPGRQLEVLLLGGLINYVKSKG